AICQLSTERQVAVHECTSVVFCSGNLLHLNFAAKKIEFAHQVKYCSPGPVADVELNGVGNTGSLQGLRSGLVGSTAGCIHRYGVVRRLCAPEYGRENHGRKTRPRPGLQLRVLSQQLTAQRQKNNNAKPAAKTSDRHPHLSLKTLCFPLDAEGELATFTRSCASPNCRPATALPLHYLHARLGGMAASMVRGCFGAHLRCGRRHIFLCTPPGAECAQTSARQDRH